MKTITCDKHLMAIFHDIWPKLSYICLISTVLVFSGLADLKNNTSTPLHYKSHINIQRSIIFSHVLAPVLVHLRAYNFYISIRLKA